MIQGQEEDLDESGAAEQDEAAGDTTAHRPAEAAVDLIDMGLVFKACGSPLAGRFILLAALVMFEIAPQMSLMSSLPACIRGWSRMGA